MDHTSTNNNTSTSNTSTSTTNTTTTATLDPNTATPPSRPPTHTPTQSTDRTTGSISGQSFDSDQTLAEMEDTKSKASKPSKRYSLDDPVGDTYDAQTAAKLSSSPSLSLHHTQSQTPITRRPSSSTPALTSRPAPTQETPQARALRLEQELEATPITLSFARSDTHTGHPHVVPGGDEDAPEKRVWSWLGMVGRGRGRERERGKGSEAVKGENIKTEKGGECGADEKGNGRPDSGDREKRRGEEDDNEDGGEQPNKGQRLREGVDADADADEKPTGDEDPSTPSTSTGTDCSPKSDIYDRFSPRKKNFIVAIVSFAGFMGPVASSSFLPSISVMAEELHTSPSVINYTVAIFIVSIAIAPIFWSPLSGFYGRRPVYLASMPIMTVASIGVANSKNLGALIATRILQGIGSSCVLAVGAGTVGDIYRPTERANAMAWFYSGAILGPTLAPVIAGIFTEYTAITWRATQYFLCAGSALCVFLILFFLPETSHPVLPHDAAKEETGKKFVPYWFNPARSLLLLRYPNIAACTFTSSCIMFQTYCVQVPLGTIFRDRYHLTNTALAGTIYLANGVGLLIGSRVAGPYADHTVRKWLEIRGYRRPEDRLRAGVLNMAVILPVSCLVYGWLLQANKGGMAPPIIMLVFNGFGMQIPLTAVNTYLVDAAQRRSAEAIAVNNFWRYIFGAVSSAFALPLINKIGFGWTNTLGAAVVWVGFATMMLTLWYGEKWREDAARRYESSEGQEEQEADGGRAPDSAAALDDAPPPTMDDVEAGRQPDVHNASETLFGRLAHSHSHSHSHSHGHHRRRLSAASHEEREHGEPSHLPAPGAMMGRTRTRARSGTAGRGSFSRSDRPVQPSDPGSGGDYALSTTLSRTSSRRSVRPTVGEVLQRTVSLGGGSVHGGG